MDTVKTPSYFPVSIITIFPGGMSLIFWKNVRVYWMPWYLAVENQQSAMN